MFSFGTDGLLRVEEWPRRRQLSGHITIADISLEITDLTVDVESQPCGAFKVKDLAFDAIVVFAAFCRRPDVSRVTVGIAVEFVTFDAGNFVSQSRSYAMKSESSQEKK